MPTIDEQELPTKVVFRKFKDGYSENEVIALFPEIPSDRYGYECLSYMHIGQHSGASPYLVYRTNPAMPVEYADLARELEDLGYVLEVRQKITYRMNEARRKEAERGDQEIFGLG